MPRTKQSDALLSMNTPAINALYGRSVTSVKTNENDLQIDLDQEKTRNDTIFNDDIFSDNVPRSLRVDQTVLAKHSDSSIAKSTWAVSTSTIPTPSVYDQTISTDFVLDNTGTRLPLLFYKTVYLEAVHANKSQGWWLLNSSSAVSAPRNNILANMIPETRDDVNLTAYQPIVEIYNSTTGTWVREMPRNTGGLNWYIDPVAGVLQCLQDERTLNSLGIDASLKGETSRPRISFIKYTGGFGASSGGASASRGPNNLVADIADFRNDTTVYIAKTTTGTAPTAGSAVSRAAAIADFRLFAEIYDTATTTLHTQEIIFTVDVATHTPPATTACSVIITSNNIINAALIKAIKVYKDTSTASQHDIYVYIDIDNSILPTAPAGISLNVECFNNNHGSITDFRRLWSINDGTQTHPQTGMTLVKNISSEKTSTVTYGNDNVVLGGTLNGQNPALYEEYIFNDANLAVGDYVSLMQVGDGDGDGSLRADALIVLEDKSSGVHSTIVARVNFKHGKAMINILSSNRYGGTSRFPKLRIAGKKVYDGGILQMELGVKNGNNIILRVYENLNYKGWYPLLPDFVSSPNADNAPTVYTNSTRATSSTYSGFGATIPTTEMLVVDAAYSVSSRNASSVNTADQLFQGSHIEVRDGKLNMENSDIDVKNGGKIDVDGGNVNIANANLTINSGDIQMNSGSIQDVNRAQIATLEVDNIDRTGTGNNIRIGSTTTLVNGRYVQMLEPLAMVSHNNARTTIDMNLASSALPYGSTIYDKVMDMLAYRKDFTDVFDGFNSSSFTGKGWMISSPYQFKLVSALGLRHNSYSQTAGNAAIGVTRFWESATLGTANSSGEYASHPNPFVLAHPSGDEHLFDPNGHGGEIIMMRRHKAPRDLLVRSVTVKSWAPKCEVNYATSGSTTLDVQFEIWITIEDGTNTNSKIAQNNSVTDVGNPDAGVYFWDTITTAVGGLQPQNSTMPWQSVPDDVWNGTETDKSRLLSRKTITMDPGRQTVRCPYLEGNLKWSWPSTGNSSAGNQSNQVTFHIHESLSSTVEKPLFCPEGKCVGIHFVERVNKSDMTTGATCDIGHHSTGGYTSGILGYSSSSVPYECDVLAEINLR